MSNLSHTFFTRWLRALNPLTRGVQEIPCLARFALRFLDFCAICYTPPDGLAARLRDVPLTHDAARTYPTRVATAPIHVPPPKYRPEVPWSRQPCDTDRSWRFLQEYLQQDAPRSLSRLLRHERDIPLHVVADWAREHAWDLRARAWDDHISVLRFEAAETEAAEMARRHARLGRRIQAVASNELRKLEDASARTEVPGLLAPLDVARYVQMGVALEKMAVASSPPANATGPNLRALDVDEVRTLRALWLKMTSTPAPKDAPAIEAAPQPGGENRGGE